MTFEQLKIFCSIVEEGGLILAAKALNKAQPSVSSSLNRLESELGFPLFSRDGYRVELTKEGKALYPLVLQLLRQDDQIHLLTDHLKRGNEAKVRISIEVLCSNKYLLPALTTVNENYPLVQIDFCSDVMTGGIEKLLVNEVDICLSPKLSEAKNIDSLFLGTERVGPVASVEYYEKISGKTGICLNQSTQVIIHESTKEERNISFGVVEQSRHWFTDNYVRKKELIVEGFGWGIMPYHLIADDIANGSLVPIDVPSLKTKDIDMYALRRNDTPSGPVAETIWNSLWHLLKGD